MSDLISREKIRDYIKGEINPYGKPFEGTAYELGLKIMRYIDAMDSDYDVEKVVEELEENARTVNVIGYGTIYEAINKDVAIKIVKHVGVSDDVCEWNQIKCGVGLKTYKISCFGKTLEMPVSTARGLKYCPYCGKKIKVVE